eukprot:4722913-Heterocapsa_arctica.AAC.1
MDFLACVRVRGALLLVTTSKASWMLRSQLALASSGRRWRSSTNCSRHAARICAMTKGECA